MSLRVTLLLILLACGHTWATEGLEIYFVRHAETQANLTGRYDSASSNTFSAEGLQQIATLTGWLEGMHFDAIMVSPVPRALDTVLPYLQKSGQRGEIWPELAECCWQKVRTSSGSGRLVTRAPITLATDQQGYFTFRDSEAMSDDGNDSYDEGVARVQRGVERLRQRYFNSGKRILIVGHYHSGQVLLSQLAKIPREELPTLQNGKVIRLRQEQDGRFTLLGSNDAPRLLSPQPRSSPSTTPGSAE